MRICVSFSGMNLYGDCPSAFNRRYVLKEPIKQRPLSAAVVRGNRVHKGVEEYLLGRGILPIEAKSFPGLFGAIRNDREPQPEMKFAFTPDWEQTDFEDTDNAQVRGIMDIAYEHDGVAHVKELKTGKLYGEHNLQRSLYGLAGALLFPKTRTIHVDTLYLDGGVVKSTRIARDQVDTYKRLWQRYIDRCQPPQEYPQRPSWKCKFCPYHQHAGGTCNGVPT